MEVTIDIDALRSYLVDYFGTAAYAGIPGIIMEMFEAENASPEELVQMALDNKIDLQQFIVNDRPKKY